MSHKFRFAASRMGLASALIPPLCLPLAACGGGGGGDPHVASIPPPPITPPSPPPANVTGIEVQTSWIPSPATRAGTYDVIGRLTLTPGNGDPSSYRTVAPGEFTLTALPPVSNGGLSYQLNPPAGLLPLGATSLLAGSPEISWDFNAGGPNFRYDNPYGDTPQYLGQNLQEYDVYSDGSKKLRENYDFTRGIRGSRQSSSPNTNLQSTLDYDIGYSYVAMGEWSWRVVDFSGAAAGDSGDLLFVNGDRTPASGIPASGTASYDAHTLTLLSGYGTAGIPFTLTADFGQRTISTEIDQDYLYDPSSASPAEPILGIHVDGSAPFSNDGIFNIPLTGTVNYASFNSRTTPPAEPVAGGMDGAFFGPHAEQVGGTFNLGRADGTVLAQDAFVGQQQQPPH